MAVQDQQKNYNTLQQEVYVKLRGFGRPMYTTGLAIFL